MTIDDYPPFKCGAFFPEQLFIPKPQEPPQSKSAGEEKPQEAVIEEVIPETDIKTETPAAVEKPVEEKVPEQTIENQEQPIASEVKTEDVEDEVCEPASGPVSETIKKMIELPPETKEGLPVLKMCAKDIMQRQVLFGSPEDSVQQALAKMQQAQTSYMLIGSNSTAEGIVSTYDLASAVSIYLKPAFTKWHRPEDDATLQIKVKWVMTKPVKTLKPETSIASVMETMCQTGLRCMPVSSANGKIEGLITVYDILRALLKNDVIISSGDSLQPTA
jgi:CBS domain-containing protein